MTFAALFGAGLAAGLINVLAGGGSFITLPVLMFLGFPAGIANGTNRVGILFQNIVATWRFDRYGVLDRRALIWAALPATAGAVIGVWLALHTSDAAFKRLLAFLMIAVSLWSLWSSRRESAGEAPEMQPDTRPSLVVPAGLFVCGVYGGFVQAGVGFLVLAVLSWAGLDLVRGNAVKVVTILCLTGLSLAIFAANGRVDWTAGLSLAAGTMIGGALGARLTVLKGHRWVRGVVTIAVIVFAVKLVLGD